ncbi:DUF4129 domain-containing protein [Jonesiaceae bacterium BS-20]|uniref:DUF4129 domain-containing protein n=1 Tax=Jonesiaceae bacterium BS-20 TaxID=3120821 RepID=A0AAU7DX00_9MICO
MSALIWADAPPLTPDADTAQYWLRQELSQGIYQQKESLFERVLRWISQWLDSLQLGPVSSLAPLIIIIVLVVAVVLAIVIAGPLRRRALAQKSAAVFDDATTTATQHRQQAQVEASAGRFAEAILQMFRAIVRSAEERVIISEQLGRTAVEAAAAIGQGMPEYATELTRAAGLFDTIFYGHQQATRADFDQLAQLDQRLTKAPTSQLAAMDGGTP